MLNYREGDKGFRYVMLGDIGMVFVHVVRGRNVQIHLPSSE